MTQILFVT